MFDYLRPIYLIQDRNKVKNKILKILFHQIRHDLQNKKSINFF